MKKFVLLIGVIISVVCQMNVMAKTVSITVHRKGNVDRSTTVCRRPINLPIDVVYDNDARQITVSGDEEMMAQVFLCDANVYRNSNNSHGSRGLDCRRRSAFELTNH